VSADIAEDARPAVIDHRYSVWFVEEVTQNARPSERRSLSARQAAEPLAIVDRIERNWTALVLN
jgi:hypothetical protein